MDRVLDGFTTCLNFRLSDRAPPDKIALAEGGTVLFETRSIDTVGGLHGDYCVRFDPTEKPDTSDRFEVQGCLPFTWENRLVDGL